MRNKLFLAGILLTALILRVISLNQSLWLDEATSVLVARDFSGIDILTKFSPGDFHPPLYYLLLKEWIAIFGSSEAAVRSLSVLFGVGTVLVTFKIGKRLFDEKVGFLASLLLATAPLHVYYSQEARMYVLETLLVSLIVLFLVKILQKYRILDYTGLIFSSILLVYTDYLPIFFLATILVYLIVFERKQSARWILWAGITILSFLPWVSTFITQVNSGLAVRENAPGWWQVLGRTSLKELLLIPVKFVIGRISLFNKVLYALLASVALLVYAIPLASSGYKKTKLLWFWLLGPIGTIALAGFVISGFSYFRLLFVLPAFYLLAAVGIFSLDKKHRTIVISFVLFVNVIATGTYLFNPRFHKEDWRGAVSFVEEASQGKNAMAFFVTRNQRDAYLYYAKSVESRWGDPQTFWKPSAVPLDKLWLFRYVQPIFDFQDKVRQEFENFGYKKLGEYDFNGVVVWEYDPLK